MNGDPHTSYRREQAGVNFSRGWRFQSLSQILTASGSPTEAPHGQKRHRKDTSKMEITSLFLSSKTGDPHNIQCEQEEQGDEAIRNGSSSESHTQSSSSYSGLEEAADDPTSDEGDGTLLQIKQDLQRRNSQRKVKRSFAARAMERLPPPGNERKGHKKVTFQRWSITRPPMGNTILN